MRIISGTRRGRKLAFAPNSDIKPLTDRIKESLFGIIGPEIPEADVLDLYAGCGSFGIEALSRGAARAVFVDSNPEALSCILKNLQHADLISQAEAVRLDAFSYITHAARQGITFRIIFLDPPFEQGENGEFFAKAGECANDIACILQESGLMIMRIPTHTQPTFSSGQVSEIRRKKYGRSSIVFYRKDTDEIQSGSTA